MTIPNYIDSINRRYKQGNTTEHSFRGDLQQMFESLLPDIRVTNEAKRQTCGAFKDRVDDLKIPLYNLQFY